MEVIGGLEQSSFSRVVAMESPDGGAKTETGMREIEDRQYR